MTGRLVALLAGPAASLVLYFIPLPLTSPAHRLAAILICVVVYWITEPIPLPITALLGTAACVLAGLGGAKQVFAAYGHPIIFLFIGSFFLAEALAIHGVDRRIACWLLSLRWVQDRPSRILMVLGTATAIASMWISNTAATAMMLPVALGVLGTLRESGGDVGRFQTGLLLMLSYGATAGGLGTLIGTPPNLIGAGLIAEQTGRQISFLTWMLFGIPLMLVVQLCAWAVLWRRHPTDAPVVPGLSAYVQREQAALGGWTRGQINASIAFLVATVLWLGPGFLEMALGAQHPAIKWLDLRLPSEMVALVAAGLLFILPVDWRAGVFTLSWRQATDINWGVILLFGGGLAFGDLMVHTQLSTAVGNGFISAFGGGSVWSLTAVTIVAAVVLSELASNTASATLLVPLAIAIAQAAGVSPLPPALGATFGASLGFALPVSTPPNAVVYGTNLIPMRQMIMTGVLFDMLGAALIWIGLRVLLPLLGFA